MKSSGLIILVVLTILVLHLFRYADTFIPTTIINLDRSPERMYKMRLQCYAYGIPFERLPAVDGNSYTFTQAEKDMLFGLALERDKNIKNSYFKYSKEEQAALYKAWEKDPKFKRSKRVMSCALSHIRAWQRYQYTTDPYILILEDDGTLHSHFRQHVNHTLQNIQRFDPEWDLIWLSGDNPGDRERILQWNRHELYRMDPPDYVGQGTGAYMFSRKGLNRFLTVIETEGCSLASDRFLIAHLDPKHSYGIHPPIVDIHNSNSPSTIGY